MFISLQNRQKDSWFIKGGSKFFQLKIMAAEGEAHAGMEFNHLTLNLLASKQKYSVPLSWHHHSLLPVSFLFLIIELNFNPFPSNVPIKQLLKVR